MTNRYVIPDLHGCLKTLRYVIEEQIKPGREDELFFLGDFINKGPESKGILDYIFYLQNRHPAVYCVRGNHEQVLLDVLHDENKMNNFLDKDGRVTLSSFDVEHPGQIPAKYINFIETLPFYVLTDDYIIVHAGLNTDIADPFSDVDSMLTIREYAVDPVKTGNRKIVHGHNAIQLDKILDTLSRPEADKINLDNGCVYTRKEGMGNLIVLNLDDFTYSIQPCLDKI